MRIVTVDETAARQELQQIVLRGLRAGREVEIEGLGIFYPDRELGVRFEVRASDLTSGDVTASIAGAKDGAVLWTGSLGALADSAGTGKLVKRVTGLHPKLWSPEAPTLYVATIKAGSSEQRVRFVRAQDAAVGHGKNLRGVR